MRAVRVILIDDDPQIRTSLCRIFNEWPSRHKMYHLQAYAAIGEAYADEPRPDAILLDLRLADSHGLDTIFRCREVYREAPIVVFTGTESDREKVMGAGASGFLFKPQVSGEGGYWQILEEIDQAFAQRTADRKWIESRRAAHDSRARLDAAEQEARALSRKKAARKKVGAWTLASAAVAALGFLLTHNLIAVLPGKADGADVQKQGDELRDTQNRLIKVEVNMGTIAEILTKLDKKLDDKTTEIAKEQAALAKDQAVIDSKLDYFMQKVFVDPPGRRVRRPAGQP